MSLILILYSFNYNPHMNIPDINELIKLWHYIASHDRKITKTELISISYHVVDEFFDDLDTNLQNINIVNINEDLSPLLLRIKSGYKLKDKLNLLISIYLFSLYDESIQGIQKRLQQLFYEVDMQNYYDMMTYIFKNNNSEFILKNCEINEDIKIYTCHHCKDENLFSNNNYTLVELHDNYWLIWKNGASLFVNNKKIMGSNRLIRLQDNQSFKFENHRFFTNDIKFSVFLAFLKNQKNSNIEIKEKATHTYLNNKINTIVFSNLDCGHTTKEAQTKNINIEISQGDLVAIIGPSGSGKSTLFKTLMGINPIIDGSLSFIDSDKAKKYDQKNYKELSKYSSQFAYVSQEEVFIKELSVYENIFYYYKLYKVANNQVSGNFKEKADSLLKQLGIFSQKEQAVSTLSGGQAKKLNIALELIKNPNILLMDEPTSGLSSQESVELTQFLKILSKDRIIFTIIHQPSFEIFIKYTKVIVLNQDGYNIFSGGAKEALEVFNIVSDKEENSIFNEYSHIDPSVLLEANIEKEDFWKTLGILRSKLKGSI